MGVLTILDTESLEKHATQTVAAQKVAGGGKLKGLMCANFKSVWNDFPGFPLPMEFAKVLRRLAVILICSKTNPIRNVNQRETCPCSTSQAKHRQKHSIYLGIKVRYLLINEYFLKRNQITYFEKKNVTSW